MDFEGPTKGEKIRRGHLTPAFSGAQKRAEMLCHPCILRDPHRQAQGAKNRKWSPTKGNKIRSGCLTPAFSGAQKRAEMLRHPCILGDPQHQVRGAKNQKWSPTKGNKIRTGCLIPAFSGGPKEGGNAMSPLHSRGSPTKGNVIRSGCLIPYFYFCWHWVAYQNKCRSHNKKKSKTRLFKKKPELAFYSFLL